MDQVREDGFITEIGSESAPPSEKRARRSVQSKLSWCKSRVEEAKAVEIEEEREEIEGKEKKEKPQARTRKKDLMSSQSKLPWHKPQVEEANVVVVEEEKGVEIEEGRVEFEVKGKRRKSQARTPKKDVKSSEPCKSPVEEAKIMVIEADKEEREGSLEVTEKGKRRKSLSRTPKKSPIKNKETPGRGTRTRSNKKCQQLKIKETHEGTLENSLTSREKKTDPTGDAGDQAMIIQHPVTDLRLEAKRAAEENVRLSAGKQTHPFFISRKAARRLPETQETMKTEARCWPGIDGDYTVSCPPVHVFDRVRDDVSSFDSKNWLFTETSLSGLSVYSETVNASSAFDGSVMPLLLDNLCHTGFDLDQLSDKLGESSALAKGTSINDRVRNEQLLSNLETHSSSNISVSLGLVRHEGNSEEQDRLITERWTSYYQHINCWPECSLWTNKYQPENALEVCGNGEAVRFLGEWLKSWSEQVPPHSKKMLERSATYDNEDSTYEVESDMEDVDDETTQKNVLLITGPVGSGKSAAVYACAKEQGFEVIEINTSDIRNGAHMKQEFGQAMDSHALNKWSVEDLSGPKRNHIIDLLSIRAEIKENEEFHDGSLEVTGRSSNQTAATIKCSLDVLENRNMPICQSAKKTLILFEDVDTVFDEDRGFISSILHLAESAKRPIILTSNRRDPLLPLNLDRFVLDFTLPSSEELLSHLYMICASEKARVPSNLLEHLVACSLCDIRRTLMLLQFWCQGNSIQSGTNTKSSYSSMTFDIDAAHLVMPKLAPWELQCKLSEKVAEEIDKTIEEDLRKMEAATQQELSSMELITPRKKQRNNSSISIKARKKVLLKRNQSFLDSEFLDHANGLEDFFDASEPPVSNARHKNKHRRGIVLSSQSDDGSADEYPRADIVNGSHMTDMFTAPISETHDLISILDRPIDPIYQFETASVSHVCDTVRVQDVSCVPESSFITVTETNMEDGNLAVTSQNTSTSFSLDTNSLERTIIGFSKYLDEGGGNTCNVDVESVNGNEELEDSHEGEDSLLSRFQLMDECSRANFNNMQVLPQETTEFPVQVDSVQETWRKLRSRHGELKPYLSSNTKDESSILQHAFGLADLISEADIMFKNCYPLLNDILNPSMIPCFEPDVCSCYEEQTKMSSTFAQHGLCFYTSKFGELGSVFGQGSRINLAHEMIASGMNTMALGKLLSQEKTIQNSCLEQHFTAKQPRHNIPSTWESESPLYDVILPTLPARFAISLRGASFLEYSSFMCKISKLECSRLSQTTQSNEKRKRYRSSRHYLSNGQHSLPDEHVALLAKSCCFKSLE